MNNGYLGMVRQWQTLFYNNRLSSVTLDCFPDAEKLAGAYGFKGRTIDKPMNCAAALEEAVAEPGPYLLNVKVTPYENVYPWCPPAERSTKWFSARRNPWRSPAQI